MEQVKHDSPAEHNVKRYTSPKTRMVFVKAQGVLCGSLEGTPGINDNREGSNSHYGFGD